MYDIASGLTAVLNGIRPTLTLHQFDVLYPQGSDKSELPFEKDNDITRLTLKGKGQTLRLEYCNDRVSLLLAEKYPDEAADSDFGQLSLCLLVLAEINDKDIRYICEEFASAMNERFGTEETPAKSSKKLPNPVSKNAAKTGTVSYDLNTFGSRLTVVYPELRAAYKENVETYGEFLAEDFLKNHANALIMQTIRENQPQKMKKLFGVLNDMYADGINELQSLIVVSVLGQLNNDMNLIANCVDYMSDELCVPVVEVNKYLASGGAKGMRMKLENPPVYNPKKANKKNLFSTLTGN